MNEKTALKQMEFMRKNSHEMKLAAESWKKPWMTLIATILSAQTRDETTIPVAERLFKKYNTLNKLAEAELSDVENTIKSVNFYRNKSKNIINCAKEIIERFKGKLPRDIDKLITLPGVGRKTANIFITEYGEQGMAVDTHVFQISRKLSWSDGKNPKKVEEDLRKLFEKKNWSKINTTLVRFGKTHTSRKEKEKLLEEINNIK